jgi:hypothetical protein
MKVTNPQSGGPMPPTDPVPTAELDTIEGGYTTGNGDVIPRIDPPRVPLPGPPLPAPPPLPRPAPYPYQLPEGPRY